jgi:hypothetical protein
MWFILLPNVTKVEERGKLQWIGHITLTGGTTAYRLWWGKQPLGNWDWDKTNIKTELV